jgi:hypothetical protein
VGLPLGRTYRKIRAENALQMCSLESLKYPKPKKMIKNRFVEIISF